MTYHQSMSAAGFAATAISYGPARMGFGLFVPEFRSVFSMSSTTVGLVSSLGFCGFFLGLLIAQMLLDRRGPKAPVLTGLGAATLGMGTVAIAPSLPVLASGVFVAASSAGFAWTPFNDAVHRKIRDIYRPTVLSEISTGTSIGIVIAGLAALALAFSGLSWRICWAAFALAGAIAFVANWNVLRHVEKAAQVLPRKVWREFMDTAAIPLFGIAFVFGTTSAIFISFAADLMRGDEGVAGIPTDAAPALVFICLGFFGLAGLFTGGLKQVVGLPWLLRALMLSGAVSVALLAILPNTLARLIASSGLQGIHIMMTSAVLALWSERLFPTLPSLSFTAALLASATGSVLGPAVAGVISGTFGAKAMFAGAAVLPTIAAVTLRDRHIQEQAVRFPDAPAP